MTVSIDVDINSRQANVKLGKLKAQLEALDDDLDLDLDLDGDLDDLADNLSDTVDNLTDAFDGFDSNLDEKISRLEELDLESTVNPGDGDSGGDTGSDSGDEDGLSTKRIRKQLNDPGRDLIDKLASGDAGKAFDGGDSDVDEREPSFRERFQQSLGEALGSDLELSDYAQDEGGFVETDSGVKMTQSGGGQYGDGEFNRRSPLNERLATQIRDVVDETNADSSDIRRALNSAFSDEFRFKYDSSSSSNRQLMGDTEFGKSSLQQHLLRMGVGDKGADVSGAGFSDSRERVGKALYDNSHLDGIVGRSGSVSNLGIPDESRSRIGKLTEMMDGFGDTTDTLKRKFRKLIPSMSTWLNIVGAAVPALGALAVQAAGVASAFGGIALAGAGMIGLGLLGHGDDLASSMSNAKDELDELKTDLFQAIEPAADAFGNIQMEFFDFIPAKIENVARSMKELTVFKSEVFEMFTQLTKFASQFVTALIDNETAISELWDSFQGIIGTSIINLFEFLLVAAQKNQDELKKLGQTFKLLGIALYQLFAAISAALVMLTPFLKALTGIGSYLDNVLVSGMIAIVLAVYAATAAFGVFTGVMGMMATLLGTGLVPLFSAMFVKISSYIFQTIAATAVTYGWAAAIANVVAALGTLLAMSGIGLLIGGLGLAAGKSMGLLDAGGGRSSGGSTYSGSGAGTTVVNEGDNINLEVGSMSRTDMEQTKDWKNSGGSQSSVDGSFTV